MLLTNVEFAPAYQVFVWVGVESLILKKSVEIWAEAVVRIAAEPAKSELITARFPALPLDTKLVRVVVLPFVKVVVVLAPNVKVLKVLVPVIAKVPAEFVTLELEITLLLDMVNWEVVEFSVTVVTLVPSAELTSVTPLPVPELVTVPVLFRLVAEIVMPLAIAELLFKTTLPVPVRSPVTVKSDEPLALELVKVLLVAPTVTAPLIVRLEVVEFSVTVVTLVPRAALIVVVPEPAPILVTVPVLLTAVVKTVMVPVVAFSLIVRLLVPVTPPLKDTDMAVPLLPIVRIPVVVDARAIAFV